MLVAEEMKALRATPAAPVDQPPAPAKAEPFSGPVGEVFAEFKEGLEHVVSPTDALTHLDLATAYWEMGLLGEALVDAAVALSHNELLSEKQVGLGLGYCLSKRVLRVSVDEALATLRAALFPS